MKNEKYRPVHIEFEVAHDGSNMPESFGEFDTPEDVTKFLSASFIAINHGITVSRHMDAKEKSVLRNEITDLLENNLPIYERNLVLATNELNEAKKKQANCQEMVNATITEAKTLAYEVKRGLQDMNLDELFTYRIPYKGRYYFYTYIDGSFRLCSIRDIPEHEKTNIWNAMGKNEEYIDGTFGK